LPRLANLKVLGLQGLELHDDDLVFLAKLSKIRKLNLNDTLYVFNFQLIFFSCAKILFSLFNNYLLPNM